MDQRIQHLHLAPQHLQVDAQFLRSQGHPGDVFAMGEVEVQGALVDGVQAGLASRAAHEAHVGGRDMQLARQQGAQAGAGGAVAALQVLEAEALGARVFGRGNPAIGFGGAGRIKVDAPAIDDRKVRVRHGGIGKESGLISRVYCRVPGRLPVGIRVSPYLAAALMRRISRTKSFMRRAKAGSSSQPMRAKVSGLPPSSASTRSPW